MPTHTVEVSSELLGSFLEYPSAGARDALQALAREGVKGPLGRYAQGTAYLTDREWQELYTRTFDLAPACAPYLTVHLFGEESFKRGALMAGLRESYGLAGFDPGRELPDHLSVVLRALPRLPAEVQVDLRQYVLARALPVMESRLRKGKNPYADLLAATLEFFQLSPTVPQAMPDFIPTHGKGCSEVCP